MKILITGGSSDLAQEIICSDIFSEHEFYITCSNEVNLQKMIKHLAQKGKSVQGFVYNFKTPLSKDQMPDNIDALILNAASVQKKILPLHLLSDDVVQNSLEDIWGNLKIIKELLPQMIEKNFGRVIFISSLSTQNGTSSYAPYIAAKSAIEGVMKNISVDYAKYNILANTLRLGLFKTSRNKIFWKRDFYQTKVQEHILQSRMGNPSDILLPINLFLSSQLYTTGSTLNLGGGLPTVDFSKL